MSNKKDLRKICLQNRTALSEKDRQPFSYAICEKLHPYLKDKTILSYFPFSDEADVTQINEFYDVAYPVIIDKGIMEAYRPKDHHFILNKYGIFEPDPSSSVKLNKDEIDVIIVPCVGFDEKKNRLGYGGGYYDRYLENNKALKIGVAFEVQKVSDLPVKENDIPLDIIVTEKTIYK